ncbi:MAG: hypothetical protein ACLULL_05780 [Parabacteroides distasonis]
MAALLRKRFRRACRIDRTGDAWFCGKQGTRNIPDIDKALHEPTDKRVLVISKAFRAGYTIDQVHELTKIDKCVPPEIDELSRILRWNSISGEQSQADSRLCLPTCSSKPSVRDSPTSRLHVPSATKVIWKTAALHVRNYRKSLRALFPW